VIEQMASPPLLVLGGWDQGRQHRDAEPTCRVLMAWSAGRFDIHENRNSAKGYNILSFMQRSQIERVNRLILHGIGHL
jgi:hypothetical protein